MILKSFEVDIKCPRPDSKVQNQKNKFDKNMRDEKYEGEGEGEERKEDYVDFGEAGDKEDPYANDEEAYKEYFRRTFIT